jgi:hypothetical protein
MFEDLSDGFFVGHFNVLDISAKVGYVIENSSPCSPWYDHRICQAECESAEDAVEAELEAGGSREQPEE